MALRALVPAGAAGLRRQSPGPSGQSSSRARSIPKPIDVQPPAPVISMASRAPSTTGKKPASAAVRPRLTVAESENETMPRRFCWPSLRPSSRRSANFSAARRAAMSLDAPLESGSDMLPDRSITMTASTAFWSCQTRTTSSRAL